MFNKKIMMTMCATVMVAALAVGGTMAFFTDTADVSNTIKTGKVKINVTETKKDGCLKPTTTTDKGFTYTGLEPGATIQKNPTVSLAEGSLPAYVRVKLNYTGFLEKNTAKQAELERALDINPGWVKSSDGYYYYQTRMKAGDRATLFEHVNFPITWKNDFANQEFKLNVVAEAVQSDYYNPTEGSKHGTPITSWKYEGKDIAIEDLNDSL